MTKFLKVRAVSASFRWATYPLAVCVAAAAVLAAPSPNGDLPSETELAGASQTIAERQRVVMARLAYKEALVRDLAAGRAGLRDVAELFLVANRQSEKCLDTLRMHNPGASDLECCAKSVLAFAAGVDLPADQKRRLKDRLASEYEALAADTRRASQPALGSCCGAGSEGTAGAAKGSSS